MNYINYLYSKEISVPTGYKFNTSLFNVELKVGEITGLSVTNLEQKEKITVKKYGVLLEGVSGEEGDLKFIYYEVKDAKKTDDGDYIVKIFVQNKDGEPKDKGKGTGYRPGRR